MHTQERETGVGGALAGQPKQQTPLKPPLAEKETGHGATYASPKQMNPILYRTGMGLRRSKSRG